jgi:hypothetical protein
MRLRTILAIAASLGLGACVAAPRMGSASLAGRPSIHLEPSPYVEIDRQLHASRIYSECGAGSGKSGPAANLDTSLIPSDEYVQEGRRAQALTEPYRFAINLSDGQLKGSNIEVTVPAGFVSDFHSMPDAAVQISLPVRRALEAAIVHDWLYAVGRPGDGAQKKLADQAYADILAFYRVEGATHWAVSSAVRSGGKKAFGSPNELRFYNKCFYGQCEAGPLVGWPELRQSPVVALRADPALRDQLWNLTVCIRYPGPEAPELAAIN